VLVLACALRATTIKEKSAPQRKSYENFVAQALTDTRATVSVEARQTAMTVGTTGTVASVSHVTLTRLQQQALADQARTDRLVARRAQLASYCQY